MQKLLQKKYTTYIIIHTFYSALIDPIDTSIVDVFPFGVIAACGYRWELYWFHWLLLYIILFSL